MPPSSSNFSAEATVDLAPLIDHALLAPTATPDQLQRWCTDADRYGFATVCVYPWQVPLAVEQLHQRRPKICTVIGFPTGATTTATKLYEAQEAVDLGANELDVVINLGLLKAGRSDDVHRELATLCEACGVPVKAILELALLTPAEVKLAAELAMDAGVAFLKTSTGWHGGATVEGVRQLAQLAQGRVGIKASGGIRTAEQAFALVEAGATRLGTSRGPDLVRPQDR